MDPNLLPVVVGGVFVFTGAALYRPLARWWKWAQRRRRCPHLNIGGIYGDMINHVGGYRLWCLDCNRKLAGPVSLATHPHAHYGDPGISV